MKLRTQLISGFSLLVGMLILIGSLSIYSGKDIIEMVHSMADRRVPNLIYLGNIETGAWALRSQSMSAFRLERATPATANSLNDILNERKETLADLRKDIEAVDKIPITTAETQRLHNLLMSAANKFIDANLQINDTLQKFAAAAASGDQERFLAAREEYNKVIESTAQARADLRTAAGNSLERQSKTSVEDSEAAVAAGDTFEALVLTIVSISLLCGVAIAFVILRSVTRTIGGEPAYIQSVMQQVSNADLSVKVDLNSGDTSSALYAISVTVSRLRELIKQIQDKMEESGKVVDLVDTAARQVAASSASQSSSTSAMAASVEEMTVSINTVSTSADDAQNIARQAGENSREGGETIARTATEMSEISASVAQASQVIQALGEASEQISTVVQVIKEVADQTNLLALNAAIEAARAGEQGRGFAVVADEVRKLAERTAQSTADISAMISKIQVSAKDAVTEMDRVVHQVESGQILAKEAGERIVSIRDEANKVSVAVTEISNALKEQSQASQEISRHVESIAQMTDENNAAAEEAASSSGRLKQVTNEVIASVRQFKV